MIFVLCLKQTSDNGREREVLGACVWFFEEDLLGVNRHRDKIGKNMIKIEMLGVTSNLLGTFRSTLKNLYI